MSDPAYTVRPATANDVEAIAELDRIVYPGLPAVWRPEQVASHLRAFPEGQLVVERDGAVVASASSLIVSLGRDPHRDHTWKGITDDGWFYNHDPYGDTLYGANMVVHPDHQRRGVGRQLMEYRKQFCRRRNLRRIVLGGRLAGYHLRAGELSAQEYAWRVEAEELVDPALTFQLAMGFALKKVMAGYLEDEASRDYGTFLEWINPEHEPRMSKTRAIRVSCVQYRMRKIPDFEAFAQQVSYFTEVAADYDADFVVFPELLTAQLMSYIDVKTALEAIRRLTDYTDRLDRLFVDLAAEFQIGIVGGTHPVRQPDGRIENIASLYLPDGSIHRQPKIHVTPNENDNWGIEGGSTLQVFETPKARVGILICYDVEFPEAARYLADQGAEVIFVPFCTDDRQAYLRVRYCAQARAVENQVYVAMAGTVGNLPDAENMDIQYAQSAVLSPSDFPFARDGILVEASVNTETVITTDLDFEALEEAINVGTVRPRRDRRPDLFRYDAVFGEGAP